MIQLANSSISPILTLFIRELSGNVSNIAFVSGMIAAVPGIAALIRHRASGASAIASAPLAS